MSMRIEVDGGTIMDGAGARGLGWDWERALLPALSSRMKPIALIPVTIMTKAHTTGPTTTPQTTVVIHARSARRTSGPLNGRPASTPPTQVKGACALIWQMRCRLLPHRHEKQPLIMVLHLRRQVQSPIEMQGPCLPLRPLTGIRGFHG
jgi:hypothetical protein